jgi:hypothetical protein
MKMKTSFILLLGAILIVFSCKKESNTKYCWQLVDPLGNNINSVCDKTPSEMQSSYPNSCSYYQMGGEEYCWLVDGNIFIKNATENSINHYFQCYGGLHAEKVACDYCQNWYSRQKNTYKPNNTFTYSPVHLQHYCGDTVHTLFQGREIVLRESTDSLITLQFSNNGIF